jgi:hypothetical protein
MTALTQMISVYDGAKDEETVIQVWGVGPATSTPAEKR